MSKLCAATSPVRQQMTETMQNNFWGLGPKVGVEAAWTFWHEDELRISGFTNFYVAYLAGQWNVSDVASIAATENGVTTPSTKYIQIPNRDFGAVAFQAILGVQLHYGR